MLTEIKQNLFDIDSKYALVHCISSDYVMGKGIAKEFANRGVKDYLIANYSTDVFKWNYRGPGYCLSAPISPWGVVYNLVTKEHYYDKPTFDSLQNSLIELRGAFINYVRNHSVEFPDASTWEINLAMPRIGCGLDRLSWEGTTSKPSVKNMIDRIFNDYTVECADRIVVLHFNIVVCNL